MTDNDINYDDIIKLSVAFGKKNTSELVVDSFFSPPTKGMKYLDLLAPCWPKLIFNF